MSACERDTLLKKCKTNASRTLARKMIQMEEDLIGNMAKQKEKVTEIMDSEIMFNPPLDINSEEGKEEQQYYENLFASFHETEEDKKKKSESANKKALNLKAKETPEKVGKGKAANKKKVNDTKSKKEESKDKNNSKKSNSKDKKSKEDENKGKNKNNKENNAKGGKGNKKANKKEKEDIVTAEDNGAMLEEEEVLDRRSLSMRPSLSYFQSVRETDPQELPAGIENMEMLDVLERAVKFRTMIRFFRGQKIPQHPLIAKAIRKAMPVARTFLKHVGFVRLVLAAKMESFHPNDDQIAACNEMRGATWFTLELLETDMTEHIESWRIYTDSRPEQIFMCTIFPDCKLLKEGLKQMDQNAVTKLSAFMSDTIRGYGTLRNVLLDVNAFIQDRTLLNKHYVNTQYN